MPVKEEAHLLEPSVHRILETIFAHLVNFLQHLLSLLWGKICRLFLFLPLSVTLGEIFSISRIRQNVPIDEILEKLMQRLDVD